MNSSPLFQRLAVIGSVLFLCSADLSAQDFSYNPPGQLVAGSGTGRADEHVYVPDMRFPIEVAPAYPNSQVWGVGGSQGPSGGQCDVRNFSYPWWDNYCESRSWDMPLCPSGQGHQGQDIRGATCDDRIHWVVASEDGEITSVGGYSVYLTTSAGTGHRYLHMAADSVAVSEGQQVSAGDRLGLMSNEFGGTPTTIHMHYDISQYAQEAGAAVFVPSYLSLVGSYERLIGQPPVACDVVPADGGYVDDFGPCFVAYGNPTFWRVESGGHEGQFHWTNAWDSANPGNWGRWKLFFAEAGEYRVEFNVVPGFNVAKKARYAVKHAEGEYVVEVDQSSVEEWFELGVFDFSGDPADVQYVDVYDNTGETADDLHLSADAIRLTRLDAPQGDMGGGEEEDMENPAGDMGRDEPDMAEDMEVGTSGCCATVSGKERRSWTPIFGLLALLGLMVRRRD